MNVTEGVMRRISAKRIMTWLDDYGTRGASLDELHYWLGDDFTRRKIEDTLRLMVQERLVRYDRTTGRYVRRSR